MHFCLLWLVRWESLKIDCFALVCTISGENGPQAGELPACTQSQVRMVWECLHGAQSQVRMGRQLVCQSSAKEPKRAKRAAACNIFPAFYVFNQRMQMILTEIQKKRAWRENGNRIYIKAAKNDDITNLSPSSRVWRLCSVQWFEQSSAELREQGGAFSLARTVSIGTTLDSMPLTSKALEKEQKLDAFY